MARKTIEQYATRFQHLQTVRSPHENKWRAIAAYMRPVRNELMAIYNSGQLPPEMPPYVTSSAAAFALDNFAGGIYGYASSDVNAWFTVETNDADLNEWHAAKTWLQTVSKRCLNSYGPAVANFYSQVPELYADAPAFGTGSFLSEFRRGQKRISDRAFSPFDLYLDVDDYDEHNSWYRPFWFTKAQMQSRGWKTDGHPQLQAARDDQRFQVCHVVERNDSYSEGRFGAENLPFHDIYFMPELKIELQAGGRYEGYHTPRWSGTGPYGFGIGHRALPDAKTLNSLERSLLENAEWQAHPAPLMPDRNEVSTVRPMPRKPIFGGMSPGGRRMVDFLSPPGNVGVTHEMLKARQEDLRNAFVFGLMQMVGRSGMTAVEHMSRDAERMRLIAPYIGRIQTEFLSRSVANRFMMLWREGQLPEPPKELANTDLKISYVSPMANAQKSDQATGTLRLIDTVIAVSQIDPTASDNLNADRALAVVRDAFNAPADVLRAPEDVEKLRAERQAMQQAQNALNMGQQGADIAQKAASVSAMRNNGMAA